MASSRKLNSDKLVTQLEASLSALLPKNSTILIGLSGGVDSVVLLHLLQQLAPRYSWCLQALHVHHGISPNADTWAEFCTGLCASLTIPLHVERVDISPLRAHGIEAAARKLRHAAFKRQTCDFIALAHHADDQAETLLLQLLRGAGVRGASAMPVLSETSIVRPLLFYSRQEILDYAAFHELAWIEDESNTDEDYPRNFLRHTVMPRIAERFPAYRQTLARSTRHFAEASELLDDLARLDAAEAIQQDTLAVTALQILSPPRARNLLRYFLDLQGATMPQVAQLADMLRQLCQAGEDAAVCVTFGAGAWQVRRYRSSVYVLRALGDFDRNQVIPWQGETELNWPALHAKVSFKLTTGGPGISMAKLQGAPVTLRLRQGGESLRTAINASRRTLKNLMQEHNIPTWKRDRLPLLYCGEKLVCVPEVAISAEYQAKEDDTSIKCIVLGDVDPNSDPV
jgi:tRNA(Ile)-lysidine synthase